MGKGTKVSRKPTLKHTLKLFVNKYFSVAFIKNAPFDSKYLLPVAAVLLIVDFCVSILVVNRVKYTEIDWIAYMQEVGGVLNGTLDYSKLRGDTGPLVYPAGFVYIYSFFYFLTNQGADIRSAQYIFVALYILLLCLIFRLYIHTKKVPPYMLILMCATSYRIHSIFILRLFNDSVAVILLYLALNFFISEYWTVGSAVYSLAVSVKMNILLYSPALLLSYLTSLGIKGTLVQLFVCATIQLLLGAPFLLKNPLAYMKGSFDIGRIFMHQWTVNWRFLPEDIFISPIFHVMLLVIHILLLCMFYKRALTYFRSYARLKEMENQIKGQLKKGVEDINMATSSQLFLTPMFVANLIGMVCSRSLHYQFYVWYYHTLPHLLWCTDLSIKWRLMLFGLIEFAWNTYPSTYFSSAILHAAHLILLYSLFRAQGRNMQTKNEE